jgi:two-component system response regulator YesN
MGLIKSLFIKLGLINRTLRIRERFGKEVLKYCVLNISEEMLVGLVKGLVFNAFEDEVVIIICAECEQEEVEQQAYEIVEMIRGNVEEFLKTIVTAGLAYADSL